MRDLPINIKCVKAERLYGNALRSEFYINSLKPGQGITVGNQLRRTLLNDLEGIAVSAIRIAGVRSEYSWIPGVREDVLEMFINLQQIAVKSTRRDVPHTQFGRLKVQGPAFVCADSIQLPSNLKILNPDCYIAEIVTPNVLEIEFKFEYGTGFRLAVNQPRNRSTENFLPMDTAFMPVKKVNFRVERVYMNPFDLEMTEFTERVFLDIKTNGTITPEEALRTSCRLVIDTFSTLLYHIKDMSYPRLDMFWGKMLPSCVEPHPDHTTDAVIDIEPYVNVVIEELQLSVRPYNCLKKAQINTVGDLLQYTPEQLLELKNFGKKSAEEVFLAIKDKFGIILQ